MENDRPTYEEATASYAESLAERIIRADELEQINAQERDELGIVKVRPGLTKIQNEIEYFAERIYRLHSDLYSKDGQTLWKGNRPIRKGQVQNIIELADVYMALNTNKALMVYRRLLKLVPVKTRSTAKISSTLSWDAENLKMVRHRKKKFDRRPLPNEDRSLIG